MQTLNWSTVKVAWESFKITCVYEVFLIFALMEMNIEVVVIILCF